jgi:ion channel
LDQPILDAARSVPNLDFRYVDQFLAALLPMMFTVTLHGQGMGLVSRFLKRLLPGATGRPREVPPTVFLILAVTIVLATHFLEVVVWAIFYLQMDLLPDLNRAMYFSMNSYSTLGASEIVLPMRWKGLAGFEAMVAMLMFGWSTAVMATVVQKVHDLKP